MTEDQQSLLVLIEESKQQNSAVFKKLLESHENLMEAQKSFNDVCLAFVDHNNAITSLLTEAVCAFSEESTICKPLPGRAIAGLFSKGMATDAESVDQSKT